MTCDLCCRAASGPPPTAHRAVRLVAWALAALTAGCASTPPRRPAAPPAPGVPIEPGPTPAPVPDEPPTPPAAPPVEPPATLPPGARLAWVNPARCLQTCEADPPLPLQRVNERGLRDRRGKHRVAAAIGGDLRALIAAGRADGHILRIDSAFRPYAAQAQLFATIQEVGRAARPGHSEHQLATAVDLRLPSTAAIGWLAENAPRFGFVVSYPPGKQRITGYRPEPWHVRHVGRELAEQIAASGLCLEEFFRAYPGLGESGGCQDCPDPASRVSCDEVTAAGLCDGTVLTWCYEGALATVDCAVSGQICGPVRNGSHDCLPAQPGNDVGRAAAR